MNFWERIQEDLKKNLQEGIDVFREGSSVFTEKIEQLTGEGKKKYKVFNLNMKVQEEFTKLGGEVYDLISAKSKQPLANRKVKSIISRISRLETQINKLEDRETKKPRKTSIRKTAKKKSTAKKTAKKTTGKTAGKTAAGKKTKSGSSAKTSPRKIKSL